MHGSSSTTNRRVPGENEDSSENRSPYTDNGSMDNDGSTATGTPGRSSFHTDQMDLSSPHGIIAIAAEHVIVQQDADAANTGDNNREEQLIKNTQRVEIM